MVAENSVKYLSPDGFFGIQILQNSIYSQPLDDRRLDRSRSLQRRSSRRLRRLDSNVLREFLAKLLTTYEMNGYRV